MQSSLIFTFVIPFIHFNLSRGVFLPRIGLPLLGYPAKAIVCEWSAVTMMSVSEGSVKDIAMATASDMAMASPRAL